MEVDEALTKLGRYSRWQMLKYALLSASVNIPGAWHMLVFVFIAAEPPHNCHVPVNVSRDLYIPREVRNGKEGWSQCTRYFNSSENTTVPCGGQWDFDESYGSTIVSEWNLVCGRSALAGTMQSVFSGGVLFGAFFFTWLADQYGRKPVHLGTQWALIICGTICAFLPDYTSFVVLTFIRGALREGVGLTGIVMMTELFPSGERTFAGTAFQIIWAVCWMLLALLGYLIRDWRYLMLTISLSSVFTIFYVWILPESVVWLMTNNKIDEAETILRDAARFNKVTLPEKLLKRPTQRRVSRRFSVISVVEGPYRCTIVDIFRSKTMVINMMVMFSLWFCDTMVYYALSLSTSLLGGDRFLNFALSGLVEIPAYLVPIYVLKRFGRRKPIIIFHFIAGLCLLVSVWIPKQTAGGVDLSALLTALVMVGKSGITASFASVVLYSSEVFPTNIRNFGFGMSSMGGRIGGMLAPFYGLLAKEIAWLPGMLCAGLSLVSGLLVLLLPETVNRPLPNTIKEIEGWSRHAKPDAKGRYSACNERETVKMEPVM